MSCRDDSRAKWLLENEGVYMGQQIMGNQKRRVYRVDGVLGRARKYININIKRALGHSVKPILPTSGIGVESYRSLCLYSTTKVASVFLV